MTEGIGSGDRGRGQQNAGTIVYRIDWRQTDGPRGWPSRFRESGHPGFPTG